MDITTKTDIEIKALIYDEQLKIAVADSNVKVLQKELSKRLAQQPQQVKKSE